MIEPEGRERGASMLSGRSKRRERPGTAWCRQDQTGQAVPDDRSAWKLEAGFGDEKLSLPLKEPAAEASQPTWSTRSPWSSREGSWSQARAGEERPLRKLYPSAEGPRSKRARYLLAREESDSLEGSATPEKHKPWSQPKRARESSPPETAFLLYFLVDKRWVIVTS